MNEKLNKKAFYKNKKFNITVASALAASALAGLFFTLSSSSSIKADDTQYTQVTSPQAGFSVMQRTMNGDNTGSTADIYSLSQLEAKVDNGKYIFDYNCFFYLNSPISDDEYLFIAILNKPQNEVVGFSKLEKGEDEQELKKYSGNFTTPYYTDNFEVHMYKQKKDEPDFTLKSENFICKSKFCSPTINCFYTYGTEDTNYIPLLDKDGTKIDAISDKATSLVRYTPNYYAIQTMEDDVFKANEGDFVVIKLPEDKKDLIAEDDKIVPTQKFEPSYTTSMDYGVLWDGVTFANFYIPDGIDEFEVWCYNGQITEDDFKWKCKIKLNRVY